MISKTFLTFLIVSFVTESYGIKAGKFFRKDYNYLEAFHNFYKIHTIPKTWADAKRMCALEGATIWHPDNDDEAHELVAFSSKTKPHIEWIFTGLSDLVIEDVFETVDGKSLSKVYNNWEPGQPDNHLDKQDCVRINLKTGLLDDEHCYLKYPFICKKSVFSLDWNQECNMPNLDYTYNGDNGKCYKLHTTPLKWTDAYVVCLAEQSSLAVIRSRSEADYLANLTKSTPKQRFKGSYQRGIYHLGFHSRLTEEWRTVTGTPVSLDAEAWFDKYEPDGHDLDECGSMLYTGLLINIHCDTKSFFICEHELFDTAIPLSISSADPEYLQPYIGGDVE